ncbi:hypothetical protein [Erythrobacter sp. THAF29]|uniref:hypothetical protein n=1 Tax=Erythrobacter sp. THAF29 TaxID=2587851 RepID=UPI001269437B|nr:hypothetical protein [Erythrobacter sp. THAF29]
MTVQATARSEGSSEVPRDPVLVEFKGGEALAVAVYRQRMLSRMINYTLTVDADGKPTECALTPKLRRKATRVAICRPLLKYMKFEPARDAQGNPTIGQYSSAINMRTGIAPES